MNKPLLIVVTGSSASGKTTLAHLLAGKINCPVLSRDKLKEGYLNTNKIEHSQAGKLVDLYIYNTFFETTGFLISKGISIIIEAAFQDKLWRSKLLSLSAKAEIRIIICKANIDVIKTRFTNRCLHNPDRQKYHGDQSISLSKRQFDDLTANYKAINMDAPTLHVDTAENYHPTIEEIANFVWQ